MEDVFLWLLNMSITASWLVAAVFVLRLLLKKASKTIIVAMWGLVAIRLLCPFSFESVLSLIPSAETIPTDIIYSETPGIQSGIPILNEAINPIISEVFTPTAENRVNPMQIIISTASVIWIIGIILMFLYAVISYIKLRKKLTEATPLRDNIWICDQIETPFVLGIFKPRIYLPSYINDNDAKYVIAHEKAHIKHRDHLWKPIGFFLLAAYWFNPVLWLAYILLCRDIEFACDEKVIKELGAEIKKPYSEALINCSVPKSRITACPVAFGEIGIRGRLKSVLNYKKSAFWVTLVAILLCIAVAIGFATNPKKSKLKDIENYALEETLKNAGGIVVEYGEYDYQAGNVTEEILNKLGETEIISTPLSQDRSENRDKTNTLVLRDKSDTESLFDSDKGVFLHFSKDFSQVWANNGVKPTLSYKITNPSLVKELFAEISNNENHKSSYKTTVSYVSYVNWYDEPDMFNESLNADTMLISSVQHLPIFKFESVNEIKNFKNKFAGKLTFSQRYDEMPSFDEATAKYDEKFFEENALLAVYVPSGSGSFRYGVYNIYNDGKNLSVNVEQTNNPFAYTDDMAGWIITVTVMKAEIKGIISFDANLTVPENDEFDEYGLRMDIEFKSPTEFNITFKRSEETSLTKGFKLTTTPEYLIRRVVTTSFGDESISFGDYMQEYKDIAFNWDDVVYNIEENETLVLNENLADTYGELPPGKYLLVKDILCSNNTDDFTINFFVYFTVTDDGTVTCIQIYEPSSYPSIYN